MKRCLDEKELMQLWSAEPDELPEQRSHLAQCVRCSAGYEQMTRDAGTIADALTVAADHLKGRDRGAMRGTYAGLGERLRLAAIFSGAAVFGGAAAFALMLTLGWHPTGGSARPARGSANTAIARGTGNSGASASTRMAVSESNGGLLNAGSLYTAEAITNDPFAGFADGSAAQAANSDSGDDLLFCVPGDDGAICDSSAEQG